MKTSRLAQRKLNKTQKKPVSHKKRSKLVFIPLLILFTLLISFFLILHFSLFSSWNGKTKLSLVTQRGSGDVDLVILDPQNSLVTTITIPKDVQVEAANNLGIWKLGSITKLGNDKKLGGVFLKDTVIKSFNFPVDDWSGPNITILINGNIFDKFSVIFKEDVSNLSFFERIKIALFTLGVTPSDKSNIDLSRSDYLEKEKLSDGSLGWQITSTIPTNIEAYFIDEDFSKTNLNVLINSQDNTDSAKIVGKTIELLGTSVASIQTTPEPQGLDCKITSHNKDLTKKIAKIFNCEESNEKPSGNFDVQIDLGSNFKNHF